MNLAKELSLWLVFGVGVASMIIIFLWLLEKVVSSIVVSLNMYKDIVQFMWSKRKRD